MAALVVVIGTASAFGSVRNLILGTSGPTNGTLGWSPDGKRIAFVSEGGGRSDLYVMNADGSAKRRLARNAGSSVWSPDGRKLAFDRQYDVPCGSHICVGSDIYVLNAGGGGMRKLPHTAGADGPVWHGPVWLPDGRLAIVKGKGKDCWRCWPKNALWVMNADGSGRRLVASGSLHGRFDWSPDGRSIVFERTPRRPPRTRIYVMAADGSDRRWLADGTRPLWSPRGEVIAFLANKTHALWRINADGSGRRKLTGTAGISALNGTQGYAWSPDGQKIVFTTGEWGIDTELWVMNADGTGQRNLTRHAGADDFAGWSPDGRKIAFVRSGELYVMNADGSGQRNLSR